MLSQARRKSILTKLAQDSGMTVEFVKKPKPSPRQMAKAQKNTSQAIQYARQEALEAAKKVQKGLAKRNKKGTFVFDKEDYSAL